MDMLLKDMKTGKITWMLDKKRHIIIGVCEKTKHVYTIFHEGDKLGILSSLIIRDFYYNEMECEEGNRCLNLSCSLNTTDKSSFRKLLDGTWNNIAEKYYKDRRGIKVINKYGV